jgi:hypothetical protein
MSVRAPARRVILGLALLALAGGLLFALVAQPRGATRTWLAPVDLSAPGEHAMGSRVALDAQGNAVAAWTRQSGDNRVVQAAVRPAGSSWQPAVDVTGPGRIAPDVELAADPRGDAVLVWAAASRVSSFVYSSARRAGGTWQPPVRVSAGSRRGTMPQVAVDARGNAFAVWDRWENHVAFVQAAIRPPGGPWRRPVDVARISPNSSQDELLPQVAVNPAGTAVVSWTRTGAPTAPGAQRLASVQAAVRPKGRGWQSPVTLTAGGGRACCSRVAVDARGNAMAVWSRSSAGENSANAVQGAVRPPGGRWGKAARLSAAREDAGEAHVAFDPSGNATVLYSVFAREGYSIVRASARPAGGAWQVPVDVSSDGERAGAPQLAVDGRGTAIAVWFRYAAYHEESESYDTAMRAASRPPGGSWQAPADISPVGDHQDGPRVAAAAGGQAAAIWEALLGHSLIAQAAALAG